MKFAKEMLRCLYLGLLNLIVNKIVIVEEIKCEKHYL